MHAHRYPEEKFRRVSRIHPCPVCGRSDWCGYNSFIASCMRVREGSFKEVRMSNGQVAYLHWLEPGSMSDQRVPVKEDPTPAPQTATVEDRDRVYCNFLRLLHLQPRHGEDLLRRGLTEWEIRKNGYRSVPEGEAPWSVCGRLIRLGYNLAGIPGFYKARGNHGTYWTFDRQPGYFIPVRDEKGRIQALQRRMDDTRGGKYKLFSGYVSRGGCSCGTPAHVAIPAKIKDRRIWITEGPLKADIASKYLGAVVVGALSAATWRPVIPVILALGAQEVIIAYDRDLETNLEIGRAFEALKAELKKHVLAVGRAVWNGKKGIDDALTTGMEVWVVRA